MPRPVVGRPPASRPRAAILMLWAIGLVYLVSGFLSGSLFQPTLPVLIALGAKENTLIANGEYWRLIGAMFLHGNLIHIFFNGYALFALGPETERIYGTGRFLVLYFLAGIAGSVASYALSPEPSVGASGAIFGLIGALGMFYYLNRAALGEFGRMQIQSMAAIVMINLIIGFSAQGTIDNWGHMGGLVGGVLSALALAPRLEIDERFTPPVLTRRTIAYDWAGAGAILLGLIGLVLIIPPA
ncbi:MAG: rhomboid family intramembrane serine protease [Oscillochloris sp.]|nr:rhomboid family intramembrane serine protease [Oscillochloris sp.]